MRSAQRHHHEICTSYQIFNTFIIVRLQHSARGSSLPQHRFPVYHWKSLSLMKMFLNPSAMKGLQKRALPSSLPHKNPGGKSCMHVQPSKQPRLGASLTTSGMLVPPFLKSGQMAKLTMFYRGEQQPTSKNYSRGKGRWSKMYRHSIQSSQI